MNEDLPETEPVSKSGLDDIAESANYSHGVNGVMIRHSVSIFRRFYDNRGSVLELGPADGLSTKSLLEFCDQVSVIEGSTHFADLLAREFPGITIHNCLFEDFRPATQFDFIYMSHVLEHVDDPVNLLKKIRSWLSPNPNGFVFCSVPNALSFHRQVGVIAGDIASEYELNEADKSIGHLRVYDPNTLRQTFVDAGLTIAASGGYFLKTLSNSQIQTVSDEKHLEALMAAGEKYPDEAADIYVVARPKLTLQTNEP